MSEMPHGDDGNEGDGGFELGFVHLGRNADSGLDVYRSAYLAVHVYLY
jgi:hypothetical protein